MLELPVWPDPEAAAFIGGCEEPGRELGGIVERGKAEFVDQDQVVAEQVSICLPTVLSARPRYNPRPVAKSTVGRWYCKLPIGPGTLADRVDPIVGELRVVDQHQ